MPVLHLYQQLFYVFHISDMTCFRPRRQDRYCSNFRLREPVRAGCSLPFYFHSSYSRITSPMDHGFSTSQQKHPQQGINSRLSQRISTNVHVTYACIPPAVQTSRPLPRNPPDPAGQEQGKQPQGCFLTFVTAKHAVHV
jgi:hypothetical protein